MDSTLGVRSSSMPGCSASVAGASSGRTPLRLKLDLRAASRADIARCSRASFPDVDGVQLPDVVRACVRAGGVIRGFADVPGVTRARDPEDTRDDGLVKRACATGGDVGGGGTAGGSSTTTTPTSSSSSEFLSDRCESSDASELGVTTDLFNLLELLIAAEALSDAALRTLAGVGRVRVDVCRRPLQVTRPSGARALRRRRAKKQSREQAMMRTDTAPEPRATTRGLRAAEDRRRRPQLPDSWASKEATSGATGATGILSTLTGKLAEESKVLAVDVSLSCCERALVPAVAASGLANSMVKLRRTLAAAILRLTALSGTAASVAILLRSDTRTSEVKSEMAPATTTSVVTIAATSGGEEMGGNVARGEDVGVGCIGGTNGIEKDGCGERGRTEGGGSDGALCGEGGGF